jgi:hypothetical protein
VKGLGLDGQENPRRMSLQGREEATGTRPKIEVGVSSSFFGDHLFSTTWPGSFLGSFFPQERIFNNFPASFSGSFMASHVVLSCVFNNFPGSFLKKGILFLFFPARTDEKSHLLCCNAGSRHRKFRLRLTGKDKAAGPRSKLEAAPSRLDKKTTMLAHESQAKSVVSNRGGEDCS